MPKWRLYPGPPASPQVFARSPIEYAKTLLYNWKIQRQLSKDRSTVPMTLFGKASFEPLGREDLAVVVVARNELRFLRSFLLHYRRLGATRFIFVDDQSEDETREFLSSQPDVDVWVSPVRFAQAVGGMLWREQIFAIYGKNRWYLNLDADEYLVYDDCFNRPLPDLISHLESIKSKRFAAPMIDMYPLGTLENATFGGGESMPWEIADCFDGKGYQFKIRRKNMKMIGGPRRRKFGVPSQLMKYPLIFWDEKCRLKDGIHVPLPFQRNFSPILGVLLHFKFFSDFEADVKDAISDGQHYANGREYKMIAEAIQTGATLDFGSEVTTRYEGPQHMVKLGFMMPIWPAAEISEVVR